MSYLIAWGLAYLVEDAGHAGFADFLQIAAVLGALLHLVLILASSRN